MFLVSGNSVTACWVHISTTFDISDFIFYFLNTDEEHPELHQGQLKKFSLQELQIATDSFSHENFIGRGGFANVYRGRLADGTLVAVKRLKEECAQGGEIQFQTEVEMISMAIHRNLVRLYGFCTTPVERLLVYPLMTNGSVASCLRGIIFLCNGHLLMFCITLSINS